MRKVKIVALVILAAAFFGTFSAWLYLASRGVCFVPRAKYRVSIPDKPHASGDVYSLGNEDYLLVLGDGSSRHFEAYYVEFDRRSIGVPNFNRSKYTRRSDGALVDKLVFEKYPVLGTLAVEWIVDEHDIRIRIMGQPPEVERSDPIDDREAFYREWMPVAYQTEVVLTKTGQAQ